LTLSRHSPQTGASSQSSIKESRGRNTAAQRSDLPGVGDFVAVRIAMGEGPAIIELLKTHKASQIGLYGKYLTYAILDPRIRLTR
jgi:hypothetical protein